MSLEFREDFTLWFGRVEQRAELPTIRTCLIFVPMTSGAFSDVFVQESWRFKIKTVTLQQQETNSIFRSLQFS